jgi:hypothetical protein
MRRFSEPICRMVWFPVTADYHVYFISITPLLLPLPLPPPPRIPLVVSRHASLMRLSLSSRSNIIAGSEVELVPDGASIPVPFLDRALYAHLIERARLTEHAAQIEALRRGIGKVQSLLLLLLLLLLQLFSLLFVSCVLVHLLCDHEPGHWLLYFVSCLPGGSLASLVLDDMARIGIDHLWSCDH